MAKCVSVPVIVYAPEGKEAQQTLERQLADVYAAYIIEALNKLNCSPEQKLELLQHVIDAIPKRELESKK